jgi:hypothetical protein
MANDAARSFASDLSAEAPTSLLTCADLASRPLAVRHPDFSSSYITVPSGVLPVTAICGVLTLLPRILPEELAFYDASEREYQASELRALLTLLLSALPCPMINRATANSLCGPFSSPLGWYQLARRLGFPVAPIALSSDSPGNPFKVPSGGSSFEAEYLGGHIVRPSSTPADTMTCTLARAGHVEYLRAAYLHNVGTGALSFVTADAMPDITSLPTRCALSDYFRSRCT